VHDDFSNPSSGWAQSQQPDYTAEYVNGGYRIFVNKPRIADVEVPASLSSTLTDVRVDAEATKVGGPNNGAFGLICRAHVSSSSNAIDSYYAFVITGDGRFLLVKTSKPGVYTLLGTGQWQSSNVIHQGQATNQLRADCVGRQLALYVNGQKLLAVQDGDLTSGAAGLLVGTPDDAAGTDIVFHQFVVERPEPGGPVNRGIPGNKPPEAFLAQHV
jgi:hypothetical protein